LDEDHTKECQKIEKNWHYDQDNVKSAQFHFTRTYIIRELIDEPQFFTSPKIPAPLREKALSIAKPEYKPFLVEIFNDYVATNRAAYERGLSGTGLTEDELKRSLGCHMRTITETDSVAYNQAFTAVKNAADRIEFTLANEQQEKLDQERKATREKEALAQYRALENKRNNPSSNTAEIGLFSNTAERCTTTTTSNFGLLPITAQPGSKFLVLEATIKNLSNNPQTIIPGSVIINNGSKPYRFSITEKIIGDPLAIPDEPINPLIPQKVRVVFRIPDEVSGLVRWEPGWNPNRLTVSCGKI